MKTHINTFAGTDNIHPSIIKQVEFLYIHVFTDNKDETINYTRDGVFGYNDAVKQAYEIKDNWIKEGHTNIRIYEVDEAQDPRDLEIVQLREECVYFLGNYPQ